MHTRDGSLVVSATDLTRYLACPHSTSLDLAVARGELAKPDDGVDEQLQLIFRHGLDHERAYLEWLRERVEVVAEIPAQQDRRTGEELTLAAMRQGADVIYQATLVDEPWLGYADFLLRRDGRPSRLGSWSYDIADTKLARRLKVAALLQMATYAQRLEALQGVAAQQLVVVAGDRVEHPWRLLDVAAYTRRARQRLLSVVADPPQTTAVPVAFCGQCRWLRRCSQEWQDRDDVSLVAGLRGHHRQALIDAGIATTVELAASDPGRLTMLSATVRARLHRQAQLQLHERRTAQPAYHLLPGEPGRGLLRLPAPDPGDVYLDFEGDPFVQDGQGREYLAGLGDRAGEFRAWWAHDTQAEAEMVGSLLAELVAQWRRHPDMHIYHYAAYEPAALKRLTGRYGVGEGDLDALLRGERFVDLYSVVRHGLQISKPSYSIKKLEDFYWGSVRTATADDGAVVDALASVVEYERFLVTGDTDILERIKQYNRQDVESTLALHDWLEERRRELLDALPRLPADSSASPSAGDGYRPGGAITLAEAADSEIIHAEKELAERLLEAGEDLLAGLVGWHRREDRPDYWEFFARADASDDELVESPATVGRLSEPSRVGELVSAKTGRVTSVVYRYTFPPQDGTLPVGKAVFDVDTRVSCGTLQAIDPVEGWLEVSRGVRYEPVSARAFGPGKPMNNLVLRQAIAAVGESVLAGEHTLPVALLRREVPAELAVAAQESPAEAVVRIGSGLDGAVLAVQGPPGAGKTFAGSALIRQLLDAGRTVGVTATSHAVIRNLLHEIGRPALHKVSGDKAEHEQSDRLVELTTDNAVIQDRLASGAARLVGGTAWLWARQDLAGALDVLVVDEAGQFSLANAVAVAGAARSLVLLGDPQQLRQPTKADHPYGAGVSALEHLIGDAAVMPADRGLFLDRTWRMHPAITSFVSDLSYESRLESAPGRQEQRVAAPGAAHGQGLRWVPVPHEGNVADSPQEARVVAGLVADLLRGHWSDVDGRRHPMTEQDVLVVAPYNAHVSVLRSVLPQGVRVGTVDKFQGQQAAVVVYSLASSSAADAPRGVNFLFDVHRLTVAVSRAKALCVLVASPALLDAPVNDPQQLRAVNALCEYVERAQSIELTTDLLAEKPAAILG